MKKYKSIFIPILVMVVVAAVLDYLLLPAWNLQSGSFWTYIIVILLAGYLAGIPLQVSRGAGSGPRNIPFQIVNGRIVFIKQEQPPVKRNDRQKDPGSRMHRYLLRAIGVIVVLMFLCNFLSGKFFHARAYSSILTVEEGSTEDIPSVENTGSIALMDTASASRLGDREIGSLSDVVSQYDIYSGDYVQVNDRGKPLKVAPLSYAGFFKWYANRDHGIPGYVKVDPVSMSASYVKLENGMTYVPGAYFNDNLNRRIHMRYRTAMFDMPHFEIDDEGKPWYIASVYEHSIFLFGGTRVIGAILVDPVTGEMQKCSISEIPDWADVIFPGDLICEQYNNHAQLGQGYFNSIIGQKDCRRVTTMSGDDDSVGTADFGYIAKGTDIWIYTGVTSVNGDSSNIGFIMSNERTGETRYISCSGADEFSAMSAAQGEVQEKRYSASFPSLILIDGTPTYIMVLKDNAGLVKMYACVNVEQYNIVATAPKQADCIARYKALMKGDISGEEANSDQSTVTGTDPVNTEGWEKKTITVKRMVEIVKNGNTYLYISDENNTIYSARYENVIEMMLVSEGDTITILTDGESFAYPAK